MNLSITVSQPIIMGGQQLKVEYSTDGVTYTFDSYQSSNTFTTTFGGFVAGTLYYFRFTLVKSLSPLVECDAVVKTYLIPEEIPCLEISGTVTKRGEGWILTITYATPSPYSAPCGGYILKYGPSYPLASIAYSTIPPSPIVLPASNQTYYVELYGVDCEGNQVLCDQISVPPTVGPCVPAVLLSAGIFQTGSGYGLRFLITPSVPAATSYIVSYSQVNQVTSGMGDPGGNVQLNATGANPEQFTIPVNPNMNLYNNIISYAGSITDGCGGVLMFDVSITIT